MDQKTRELYDFQNRERTEDLSQKVALLKNYAVDIENETYMHNRHLDEVDNNFDSNFAFITNARNQLNRLVKSNRSPRFTCYLSLAICIFFFVVYFIISYKMN